MLFPKTIAEGDAFCNRETEREILAYNFTNLNHTLIVSPRRYGKTSLILKAIDEKKWPYAHIDLFLAFDESKIIERMLRGISELVSKVIPINVKAIQKIREFFKAFTLTLNVGEVGVGLKIESADTSSANTLRNAIESLELFLSKYKQKCVFFIDEIQDIVNVPFCDDVESILRYYAQKTKHIVFVFSGSNRKLLKALFDDKSRPLFKICDRINLQRIKEKDYITFINKAAKKRWGSSLSDKSMQNIFEATQCHPYYVNYTCSHLWRNKTVPSADSVYKAWSTICDNELSNIANDIDALSINQKKLLELIARQDILFNPTKKETQQAVMLTSRGILQSLQGLLVKDIVEKTSNDGIRIVDPLLKTVLLREN